MAEDEPSFTRLNGEVDQERCKYTLTLQIKDDINRF
jgi:hypothetical protein